jgi:hypothetical protein
VRITLGGKRRKSSEKFRAAMRIDTLTRNQPSERTRYFHVKQVGDNE